jgi:hypothetical protein
VKGCVANCVLGKVSLSRSETGKVVGRAGITGMARGKRNILRKAESSLGRVVRLGKRGKRAGKAGKAGNTTVCVIP